jgi:cytochrome P450
MLLADRSCVVSTAKVIRPAARSGRPGPHRCPGMTLDRRELEVALVRRMPRLRLDEERPPRRRAESLVFRGLELFPVRFD